MYGLPPLYAVIAIITAPVLAAIFMANLYETWYSVMGIFLVFILDGIGTVNYFAFFYADWISAEDDKIEKPKQYPNMNNPQYAFTTVGVHFDPPQLLAKALRDMRKSDVNVKLTEAFWIEVEKPAVTSRWVMLGGSGPKDFRETMDRWIKVGAVKREGGQGKRVVGDWKKIYQIQCGDL
jgi:hypothetical protein